VIEDPIRSAPPQMEHFVSVFDPDSDIEDAEDYNIIRRIARGLHHKMAYKKRSLVEGEYEEPTGGVGEGEVMTSEKRGRGEGVEGGGTEEPDTVVKEEHEAEGGGEEAQIRETRKEPVDEGSNSSERSVVSLKIWEGNSAMGESKRSKRKRGGRSLRRIWSRNKRRIISSMVSLFHHFHL
jgi:hypothetical protein